MCLDAGGIAVSVSRLKTHSNVSCFMTGNCGSKAKKRAGISKKIKVIASLVTGFDENRRYTPRLFDRKQTPSTHEKEI